MKNEKKRINRCRYSKAHYTNGFLEHYCTVCGTKDDQVKICTEVMCEGCNKFNSYYIEYPITVEMIYNEPIKPCFSNKVGSLVAIRPSKEENKNRTYLGIYLGDLPFQIKNTYYRASGILSNSMINDPAIYVPELKQIIYGCESCWHEIESKDEFMKITANDGEINFDGDEK